MKYLSVLGAGSAKCGELYENVEKAANELGLEYELSRVSDTKAILGFGVTTIPALVVDDQVKVRGRVPTVEELKILLA